MKDFTFNSKHIKKKQIYYFKRNALIIEIKSILYNYVKFFITS